MSVPEIIKSALPVAAAPGIDAASNVGTPTKATAAAATTTITTGAVATSLRAKNQQATGASEKMDTSSQSTATTTNSKGKVLPKTAEEFYKELQQFHERRGTPIMHMPKVSGRAIDLHNLYLEVTERGGFHKVNTRDEWDEVLPTVGLRDKCVNASAVVKHIYRRFLDKYERLTFFGEDPDKMEALEAADADGGRSRSSRYPSLLGNNNINAVPMSYNYRQHVVNMERRRTFRLSTDLHKHSSYEKLMLSLISPLPNEQDFAINVCTLMANETKHTLKLNDYPKLVDMLVAHAGVFADYSLRKVFHHSYTVVRHHSLYAFWRELLHEKPQILDLYTDEQALREAALIDESEEPPAQLDCFSLDFLNLGRGEGTQDFVGQRVKQIISILRNLSFFEENVPVFAKNRTLLRFLVMSANVRCGE